MKSGHKEILSDFLTIKQASTWASWYIGKDVSPSNISYLIQYGKVRKYGANGNTSVKKYDLISYYSNSVHESRETQWRTKLGEDLNWDLSFSHLKEKDTTKHVHRLHPYKGKFIPQLVEYFLDSHTDSFKKEVYFSPDDIILDPFSGSGTTLVQANELGIHAVGIDVSAFNALIANVKISRVDTKGLEKEIQRITSELLHYISSQVNVVFEQELLEQLSIFNAKYFPSPGYKIRIKNNELNEKKYSAEKEAEFREIFYKLLKKYNVQLRDRDSDSIQNNTFLDTWYISPIRSEINVVYKAIEQIPDNELQKILKLILSRTIRSCRATTHADLATLKQPVTETYYCRKHGKICKPLFSILSWWKRYCKDTVKRFSEFNSLRTSTRQLCLTGDGRNCNIVSELEKNSIEFAQLLKKQKFRGIFTSPPYLGLIDYHEQHAYAYELFSLARKDNLEIGSMKMGQGRLAKEQYIHGISEVLLNAQQFLQENYDVFIVANDKHNLYPSIAEKSRMKIVNCFKRPVLNRVENDTSAYSEMIFHLKAK